MATGGNQYNAALAQQQQAQNQLQGMMMEQLKKTQEKSPSQKLVEERNETWLKFAGDPNKRWQDAPGTTYTGIHETALAKRALDQSGAGRLGRPALTNPNAMALVRQNRADTASQIGSDFMSTAIGGADASARGDAFGMMGMQQQKDLGLSNILAGASDNANDTYTQALINKPSSPIWGVLGAAVGGLAGGLGNKLNAPSGGGPATNQFAAPSAQNLTRGVSGANTLPWLGGPKNAFSSL